MKSKGVLVAWLICFNLGSQAFQNSGVNFKTSQFVTLSGLSNSEDIKSVFNVSENTPLQLIPPLRRRSRLASWIFFPLRIVPNRSSNGIQGRAEASNALKAGQNTSRPLVHGLYLESLSAPRRRQPPLPPPPPTPLVSGEVPLSPTTTDPLHTTPTLLNPSTTISSFAPHSFRGELTWISSWTKPLGRAVLQLLTQGCRKAWSATCGNAFRAAARTLRPTLKPKLERAWASFKPKFERALDRAEPKLEFYMRRWFLPKLDKEQLVGLIGVAAAELSNREVEGSVRKLIDSLPTESQRIDARKLAKAFASNPNSMSVLSGVQNSATMQLLATLNETVSDITAFGEEVFGTGLGLVNFDSSNSSLALASPRLAASTLSLSSLLPSPTSSNSSSAALFAGPSSSSSPSSAALAALLALGSRETFEQALLDLDQKTRLAAVESLNSLTEGKGAELSFQQLYEVFLSGAPPPDLPNLEQLLDLSNLWAPLWENRSVLFAEALEALSGTSEQANSGGLAAGFDLGFGLKKLQGSAGLGLSNGTGSGLSLAPLVGGVSNGVGGFYKAALAALSENVVDPLASVFNSNYVDASVLTNSTEAVFGKLNQQLAVSSQGSVSLSLNGGQDEMKRKEKKGGGVSDDDPPWWDETLKVFTNLGGVLGSGQSPAPAQFIVEAVEVAAEASAASSSSSSSPILGRAPRTTATPLARKGAEAAAENPPRRKKITLPWRGKGLKQRLRTPQTQTDNTSLAGTRAEAAADPDAKR